jgi:hypothetical protein
MSVFTEAWAGPLPSETTVPLGAALAPAGTPELWTMAGGYAAFPAADPALIPPSLFRVYDRDASAEAILVRETAPPGTWQVTRGDQGTPVLAHAPGFTVRSLISPAGLAALAAGVPSGNGLVLPAAAQTVPPPPSTSPPQWNDALPHTIAQLLIPGGEALNGAVYELLAWGWYTTRAGQNSGLFFGLAWGATPLGPDAAFTTPGPGINEPGVRWKIHSAVSVYGSQAAMNSTVWVAERNAVDRLATPLRRFMFGGPAPTPVTTTAAQLLTGHVTGADAAGALPAGLGITLAGSKAWRAA